MDILLSYFKSTIRQKRKSVKEAKYIDYKISDSGCDRWQISLRFHTCRLDKLDSKQTNKANFALMCFEKTNFSAQKQKVSFRFQCHFGQEEILIA